MSIRLTTFAPLALAALALGACGPSITQSVRYDSKPFSEKEYRQEKDGLVVENRALKELPASFFATAQACSPQGMPLVDQAGQPVLQKVSVASPGQLWYQLAITNNTGHVLRLSSAVIRQFDPAGNQVEPLAKEDLVSSFLANRRAPRRSRWRRSSASSRCWTAIRRSSPTRR